MRHALITLLVLACCPSLLAATPKSFPMSIVSSTRAGGPIFNTGIYPNRTTHVQITYMVPTKTTGEAILFGERDGTFRFDDFFQTHQDSLGHHFQFGGYGEWNLNWDSGNGGSFGKISTVNAGIRGISLDDVVYKTAAQMAAWNTSYKSTSAFPLALFTSNDTGTDETQWNSYARSFQGSLYEAVIWTNTTVQARHYFPCVADDDTVGLYDTVNNTFIARVAGNANYAKGTLTAEGTSDKIRLEADGSLAFSVQASSCTNFAGTVSVNGSTDPVWVVQGQTAEITATPATGYTFVRWTGDTEFITTGSVTDPTVTVTSKNQSIKLIAKFFGESVSDRILTVFVDKGLISSNNYFTTYIQPVAGTASSITNIEKCGVGALKLVANSVYDGDWHVREGEVQFHDANSFGKEGTSTASNGRIYVDKGATLYALPGPNTYAMKNKDVYLAGSGWGGNFDAAATDGILNPYRYGALVGSTRQWNASTSTWNYDSQYYGGNIRYHLTDDAAYYQPNRPFVFYYDTVDVDGHTFSMSTPGAGNIYIANTLFTNSASTAGTVTIAGGGFKSWLNNTTFSGSTNNVFDARGLSNYPLTFQGKVTSSWLFKMGGLTSTGSSRMGSSADQKKPDGTTAQYNGRISFNEGLTYFYNHDTSGYALTLNGEISGGSTASWNITRGFSLNIGATNNTFAGTINLDSKNATKDGVTYTARLKYLKGAEVSASAINLEGASLVFDDSLTFVAPPITVTNTCSIAGGSDEVTFPSLTLNGNSTLTLTAPGSIQTLTAGKGSTLILPEGTTCTVDKLIGLPTATGGTLKALNWEFDAADGFTLNGNVILPTDTLIRVTNLSAGTTTILTVAAGETVPNLTNFYVPIAASSKVTFSTQELESGDVAVIATVTENATTGSATWAQPTLGGVWSAAASWENEAVPSFGPATDISFPKATKSDVPVTVDMNSSFGSLSFATGEGLSDFYTPFGYAIAGSGMLAPDPSGATMSFLSGQNRLDAPLTGDGTLNVLSAFYPYTNLTAAVYQSTTLGRAALKSFTGQLVVNATGDRLRGDTTLETADFTGTLNAAGGRTWVDSLDFVKTADDLTLSGYGVFWYTGKDATIPGLTMNVTSYGYAIGVSNSLTVSDMVITAAKDFYKAGPGKLIWGGTRSSTFAVGTSQGYLSVAGFSSENTKGRFPVTGRHVPFSITDGTLEIGVKDDPDNAPNITVTPHNHTGLTGIGMGSGFGLGNPTLILNNGKFSTSGDFTMNFYTLEEPSSAKKTVIVNGGELAFRSIYNRIGWQGWPRAAEAFIVNGGKLSVARDFNLTQLCPYDYANDTQTAFLRTNNIHTCTINGGEMQTGNFRMGYAYGLSWDGSHNEKNGYGQAWQPDAYLTMNGGTLTVTNCLLATDRSDSRSWTILNGGTLRVNAVSNTVGKTAATFLTFNGGTWAPLGTTADGEVWPDIFQTAAISTNGAVFDTSLCAAAVYSVSQAFSHDAACPEADGGLVKTGSGTLELAGANTYTGPTRVSGGTLAWANESAIPGDLILEAGGKVAKTGDWTKNPKRVFLDLKGESVETGSTFDFGTISGKLRVSRASLLNDTSTSPRILRFSVQNGVLTGQITPKPGLITIVR